MKLRLSVRADAGRSGCYRACRRCSWLAVSCVDIRRKGLRPYRHHLRGGYLAEVLNEMLGVLFQRRDIALDDGLFFVGQKVVAQGNQVAEQVAAGA